MAAIYFQDAQQELAKVYKMWERRYPDTLQWKKSKAHLPQWWDLAAGICRAESIPPMLLMFVTCKYLNSRAEEAEVPFSANVMRSESLIYRALSNFRMRLNMAFKPMLPLYALDTGQVFDPPRNTLEYARTFAEYSCKYFELVLEIRTYEFARQQLELPGVVHDNLAYTLCEQNPFLLLRTAKTPKFRALAAVNAYLLADAQPWHTAIWEGVSNPYSLSLPEMMAGVPVAQFYEDGQPCWCWPMSPAGHRKFQQLQEIDHYPGLKLTQMRLCQKTEMFLSLKLEAARKGAAPPSPGW